MSDAPLPVVLDCDTANEVDDQFAIAYALGSPTLDVRGVVSVHDTLFTAPAPWNFIRRRRSVSCGYVGGQMSPAYVGRSRRWRRAATQYVAKGWTS